MGKYGTWDLTKNKDGKYELVLYPANEDPKFMKATFRGKTMEDIIKKYESLR